MKQKQLTKNKVHQLRIGCLVEIKQEMESRVLLPKFGNPIILRFKARTQFGSFRPVELSPNYMTDNRGVKFLYECLDLDDLIELKEYIIDLIYNDRPTR